MSQLFSFHEKIHCLTPACLIFCANSRSHEYLFYHNGSPTASTSLFASAIQRTLNLPPLIHLSSAVVSTLMRAIRGHRLFSSLLKNRAPDCVSQRFSYSANGFYQKSQQTSGRLKCPWTSRWNPTGCGAAVQLFSWPPVSQRRDDLKHKASINIKVHRPHRAAKEHTVNLRAPPQTALGPSHTNAHAPWCRVFNEIISRSPFLNHDISGRAFLQNVYMLRCGCQSNTWGGIHQYGCLHVCSPLREESTVANRLEAHVAWADWNPILPPPPNCIWILIPFCLALPQPPPSLHFNSAICIIAIYVVPSPHQHLWQGRICLLNSA